MLKANTTKGVAANLKVAQIKDWVSRAGLDPEVHVKYTGADEEGQNAAGAAVAMAASLFLMFVILLWQFNSFYGVIVTSAVILSTVGVLLGIQLNLLHTFDYISVMMTGTGVVALAGAWSANIVLVTPSISCAARALRPTKPRCAPRPSGSGR